MAVARGLPVLQPEKLGEEAFLEAYDAHAADTDQVEDHTDELLSNRYGQNK